MRLRFRRIISKLDSSVRVIKILLIGRLTKLTSAFLLFNLTPEALRKPYIQKIKIIHSIKCLIINKTVSTKFGHKFD